jgi:putative phosphoribosyl transferase
MHIPDRLIARVSQEEELELNRRERVYRGDRPPLEVAGHTVIVVDDGLATGSSMRAATVALKKLDPARIVVAVPVAAPETCSQLETEVDEIVCARTPDPLHAVGLWYENFDQITDDEVRDLLERASKEISAIPTH